MLSIIIPAAANGRCTSTAGHKSLFLLNDETIIQRQVRLYRERFPDAEIIVVVGYRKEEFLGHLPNDVRMIFNPDYKDSFVTESIRLGMNAAEYPRTLISYGDLVFVNSIVSQLDIRNDSMVVAEREMGTPTSVSLVNDGYCVTNFGYGLPDRWCQLAYLCEEGTEFFKRELAKRGGNQRFTQEIFNHMISYGFKFRVQFAQPNSFFDIDTKRDYEDFLESQFGK